MERQGWRTSPMPHTSSGQAAERPRRATPPFKLTDMYCPVRRHARPTSHRATCSDRPLPLTTNLHIGPPPLPLLRPVPPSSMALGCPLSSGLRQTAAWPALRQAKAGARQSAWRLPALRGLVARAPASKGLEPRARAAGFSHVDAEEKPARDAICRAAAAEGAGGHRPPLIGAQGGEGAVKGCPWAFGRVGGGRSRGIGVDRRDVR